MAAGATEGRGQPGGTASRESSAGQLRAERAIRAPARRPHGEHSPGPPRPGQPEPPSRPLLGSTGRRRPGHFKRRVGSGSAPLRAPPAPRSGSAAPAAPALQVKGSGRRRRGLAVTPTGAQRSERSAPSSAPLRSARASPPQERARPGLASPRHRRSPLLFPGWEGGAAGRLSLPVSVSPSPQLLCGWQGPRASPVPRRGRAGSGPQRVPIERGRGGAPGRQRSGGGAGPDPPGKLCSRLARGLDGRRSAQGIVSASPLTCTVRLGISTMYCSSTRP